MTALRRPRPGAALLGLALGWLALYEVAAIAGVGLGPLGGRFVHVALILGASAVCIRRGRGRPGFLLLGLACLAWSLGELYYTAVLWSDPSPPIPSPADAGYQLFPVLALAGIVVLAREDRRRTGARLVSWVDGLLAACAVGAASAAIVLQPVLDHLDGRGASALAALCYPLADLVLIGTLVGILAGRSWRLERAGGLIVAGGALFWLADSYYLARTATGTYESGGWFDVGWWAAIVLIAVAADPRHGRSLAVHRREASGLLVVMGPVLFGGLALAVLLLGLGNALNPLALGLAVAALLAVIVRLALTVRAHAQLLDGSRREALTDALTGLGNRRALVLELEEAAAGGRRPAALALFDLNGFKAYNDGFGHPAGDVLLQRLGARLQDALEADDRAFRMGGDEFCVLLGGAPGRTPAERMARAAAALRERGPGFDITAAAGVVELGRELVDPSEALREADRRMYADKFGGRGSVLRQAADALRSAMAERDEDLADHAGAVAELAARTGARLGVDPMEGEYVRAAAELHDVGKIAIPEAILHKPAALDEAEWAFVRRHTVIGERILASAPALAPVARIVRSTHERVDGGGYPDGLAGEAIPLGARIIAVADAYDAMVTDRPYRAARPSEEALAELARCAGTQFDPGVVEAFAREVRAAGPADAAAALAPLGGRAPHVVSVAPH